MNVEHSVEIERKYDVDERASVPALSDLPGVSRVGDADVRMLDAHYFDTADRALARQRTVIRRRTGGPDEGWHVKRATPAGKLESRWPLEAPDAEGSPPSVPLEVVSAVAGISGGPFAPIARVRNTRTAYALLDANGELVAEFVDDRVLATDHARDVDTSWREWELELGPAARHDATGIERFFAAADLVFAAAGATPSRSESKLGRALGG